MKLMKQHLLLLYSCDQEIKNFMIYGISNRVDNALESEYVI